MNDENPYAASSSSLPPPMRGSEWAGGHGGLEPTGSFVKGIKVFMIIQIISLIGITVADNLGNVLIPGYSSPDGNFDLTGTAMAIFAGMLLALLFYLISFITVIVLVCRFMSRTNRNARRMGATRLQYSPGWCTGWWFIPFANLVMPYRCMKEIWLASETPDGYRWFNQVAPSFLTTWWAFWLIGNILTSVENRLVMMMDVGIGTMMIGWISTACLVIAGFLLIKIVSGIHELQFGERQVADEYSSEY